MAPRRKQIPPIDSAPSNTSRALTATPNASLVDDFLESQLNPSQPDFQSPITPASAPRKKRKTNPMVPDSQASQQSTSSPFKGQKNWTNDSFDRYPTSMRCLLDWLAHKPHHDRLRFGHEGSKALQAARELAKAIHDRNPLAGRTPQACKKKVNDIYKKWKETSDWKHSTGTGGGQTVIDNAPINHRDDAERDVLIECRLRCPDWDELDAIFKDRDGGTASLRGHSSSTRNPALEALENNIRNQRADSPVRLDPLEDEELDAEPMDWPLTDDETVEAPRQEASRETSPVGEVIVEPSNEASSMSDRAPGGRSHGTDPAAQALSLGLDDYTESEDVWRQKKEGYLERAEGLKREELELRKEKLNQGRYTARMTAAKVLYDSYHGSRSMRECFEEAIELEDI